MKKVKSLLLVLFVLPVIILFSACSDKPYVTGIEKTKTIGNMDTYTVTYSDGSTSLLTVENGEDGKDATITLDIIKEYCEEKGISLDEYFESRMTVSLPSSVQDVTNQVLNSSVGIWCEIHINSTYTKKSSLVCGSGVIFEMGSEYSYIITNYHVVYSVSSVTANKIASKIRAFQYGTSETVGEAEDTASGYPAYQFPEDTVECTYIGGTMDYDLAVLKVKTADLRKNNPNACAVTFATDHKVGEDLIAVGNPEGQGLRVTYGHVSKESEYTTLTAADEETVKTFRVLGIDVAVNGGNSGGGIYNSKGELVGIVNAKLMTDTSGHPTENMSYALPAGNVEKVVGSIMYYYNPISNPNASPKKLFLNIKAETTNFSSIQDEDTGIITLYDQLKVSEVTENSLGDRIGLKVDDIITEMRIVHSGLETTYKLNHAYELYDLMFTVRAGDQVVFKVLRNGVENTVGISIVKTSDLQVVG